MLNHYSCIVTKITDMQHRSEALRRLCYSLSWRDDTVAYG